MWTKCEGRMHPPAKRWAGKAECRSGENLESGTRHKGLGCRVLRLEEWYADEETTDYTDGHGWRDGDAGQDADGEQQIKCITVIHLIRGCAVTTCDFHDARFERLTGGIDRPATRAKLLQEATESTESDSRNSLLGSTGHRPTGIELGESTALFSLSSDGGGGEGRGEESRFYWISPLPNPPPARSSRGEGDRRSTFLCLIQWPWATGLCRPATRRAERRARPEAIKTGFLKEAASIFRSASRRPERASRPCYPFSGHALSSSPCGVPTR